MSTFGASSEPWMAQAACRDEDPELFYSAEGERSWDPRPAKRVCAGCPVAMMCYDYALRTRQRYGVWAGVHLEGGLMSKRKFARAITEAMPRG